MLNGAIVFERSNEEAGLGGLHEQVAEALGVEAQAADLLLRRCGKSDEDTDDAADASWRSALEEVATLVWGHYEAAAAEIGLAVQYVGHRYPEAPISGVSFVGGAAAVPGVIEQMAQQLGTPHLKAGAAALSLTGPAARDAAGLAMAAGLATHPAGRKGVAA